MDKMSRLASLAKHDLSAREFPVFAPYIAAQAALLVLIVFGPGGGPVRSSLAPPFPG